MPTFEYKIVPAPRKIKKIKGVRGSEDRYARNLSDLMNELAADGWEYQRAESLPVDEKTGMMGKTQEIFHNVLVFRRENIPAAETAPTPEPAPAPVYEAPNEAADPAMLETLVVEDAVEIDVPELGPAVRD